jgi:transcriptional regulator with XRE-family HTH domain
MTLHAEIGKLLAQARKAAGLTQEEVAQRLELHQSRVSRLESGEGDPKSEDYAAYLKAINTNEARKLRAAIEAKWKHLPQPPLRHPDLQFLLEVETALNRLYEFKSGASVPQVLAGQAELLFRRLFEFGEFLLNLDHRIVYVGEIGVGKTTAVCRQAGLITDPARPGDLKGMMLDTGGGRTTLCDVYIQAGDRFSLEVEPIPDEEIYRLVEEFCRSVLAKGEGDQPASNSADFRLPEEVERAIRVMAKLPRPVRRKGSPQEPDPAAILANGRDLAEFKAEVASRLTLWRRTRRFIDFEGGDQLAGRRWLRETFTRINNGRHDDFSLPGKIVVTVPFNPVPNSPFNIALLDTRGVDGSAIRPDILSQLKDRRALTVLCAKWGSAPDPSIQDLLRHVVETEVDPTLFSRLAVLVIARAGDALAMRHDSGESAQDTTEGYEIKRSHVDDALLRISMSGIAVELFDAASDDSAELTEFLLGKIADLRAAQRERAETTISAIDQMLSNVEKAQAIATLDAINEEFRIFAERHAELKPSSRSAHSRLLGSVRTFHPRTIWATTRRGGEFWNFDVYQHLGDGAAAEAKRRSASSIDGLRELISNRLENPKYEAAHAFLGQLLDDVNTWEADFVKAARHHAVAVFKPELSAAHEMWARAEAKYGQGLNYREEVASELEEWFDNKAELQEALEQQIRRSWRTSILQPLRDATGNASPHQSNENGAAGQD